MKATTITVSLLVTDDVAKKFRKKLAADIHQAIQDAIGIGTFKYLTTDCVVAVKVAHTPYKSEFSLPATPRAARLADLADDDSDD